VISIVRLAARGRSPSLSERFRGGDRFGERAVVAIEPRLTVEPLWR
jgi:hypothetical protein